MLQSVPGTLQHLTVGGKVSVNFARALKELLKMQLPALKSIDLSGVDERSIGEYRTQSVWRDRILKHRPKVHVVINS